MEIVYSVMYFVDGEVSYMPTFYSSEEEARAGFDDMMVIAGGIEGSGAEEIHDMSEFDQYPVSYHIQVLKKEK